MHESWKASAEPNFGQGELEMDDKELMRHDKGGSFAWNAHPVMATGQNEIS